MSNIDKQAKSVIRELIDDARSRRLGKLIITADEMEVLLDELEAKDNRINRLEAIVAVAEQRNALMREWKRALKVPCDLVDDQVPVVIHGMVICLERLKETEDKLTAAEKRIAELEAREVNLPKLSVGEVMRLSGFSRDYAEGWCSGNDNAIHEIHAAGVKVAAAAAKGE